MMDIRVHVYLVGRKKRYNRVVTKPIECPDCKCEILPPSEWFTEIKNPKIRDQIFDALCRVRKMRDFETQTAEVTYNRICLYLGLDL